MIRAVQCRAQQLLQRASHRVALPTLTQLKTSRTLHPRGFSSSSPAVNNGEESEFDNDFLEDVMGALPTDYSTQGLIDQNVEWGAGVGTEPPLEWVDSPPVPMLGGVNGVKKGATHTKTKYPPRAMYQWNKFRTLFKEAQVLLVLTHYMEPADFDRWRQKVLSFSPDLRISTGFKNAQMKAILKGTEDLAHLAPLASLFTDQVILVSTDNKERVIQDLEAAMKVKGDLLWMGGAVQGTVLDHEKLKTLSKAGSEEQIRAQIIGILMGAPRNLIRVLKYPTDGVVKVLNFKATEEGGEGGEAAEGAEGAEGVKEEGTVPSS